MWRTFLNCRKKCEYRYEKRLRRDQPTPEPLYAGTLFHEALDTWHRRFLDDSLSDDDKTTASTRARIHEQIDAADDGPSGEFKPAKLLVRAMMDGYIDKYENDGLEVIAVEQQHRFPILNPKTGFASRTCTLEGKIDCLVRRPDHRSLWLLESKTASVIDGPYIERLAYDRQILTYCYLLHKRGYHIKGIFYDVVAKAKLKQSKGETEEEFEERYALLCKTSKTGKSSAKRKMPETDEAFLARLAEKYRDPSMYVRQEIYLDMDLMESMAEELWMLSKELLSCRRNGRWPKNSSECTSFGRTCEYFPLCTSNDDPAVRQAHYYEDAKRNPELEGAF